MLGGSVAVVQDRSINTLPSTTSPASTKRQTKSMPSSRATRRPTPSEPTATRPWRRVSDFHTRSLCRVDTVPSIRNVASPQVRSNVMLRLASTYRAEGGRSKHQQVRATAPARSGISPEASLRAEAFRGQRSTKRHAFRAGHAASTSASSARRARLARGAEFELDVVGIAEDQDRDAERFAEVAHLAVRNAARVQQADGILEVVA
jgi:hypothetical protein